MELNILGLCVVIALYLAILLLGIWAAWTNRRKGKGNKSEVIMVANRDIGFLLGSFTVTATWVGGGYINGTSEAVYAPGLGLIWTQAPWCLAIGVTLVGFFIAEKMRNASYVTMLDPLQNKLGRHMGALLFLPALCGDIFWAASILSALGGTLSVILNIDVKISVIFSSCVSILYTLVGGLYAVAYTDVVQLLCMFGGLWLCIPFAMTHPAVTEITLTSHMNGNETGWLGELDPKLGWEWFDFAVTLVGGAVPWQVYYQRVLACKDARTAKLLSVVSAAGFLVLTIPPVIIGAIAASTDWNATDYEFADGPAANNESSLVLPLVLQYLTPTPVAIIGLAAVSSAVMSSTDSITLSSASMFSHNVYKKVIRPHASDRETVWVIRIGIIVIGAAACALALAATSVYGLFVLCVDVAFVVLSPQMVCVLYFDINTYGALPAFFVGFLLRIGGGEPAFNFDPIIPYPGGKTFPFRTFSMLMSLGTLLSLSYLAKFLFEKKYIPAKYDIFQCKLASGGRTRFTNEKDEKKSSINNGGQELLEVEKLKSEEGDELLI
nr:high affinity choline transporter 1-like isoform X2 [Styela clava]